MLGMLRLFKQFGQKEYKSKRLYLCGQCLFICKKILQSPLSIFVLSILSTEIKDSTSRSDSNHLNYMTVDK